MSIQHRATDLTPLFRPGAIAVVGATEEARRPGGQAAAALMQYGYRGGLQLVNPGRSSVHGRVCHPSVLDLPAACDVALVAVPAEGVPEVIEQCGERGIPFAIVLGAGFREAGNDALEARLRAAIDASGVRVVGPNCVGLLNLHQRVFAGFGAGFRNPALQPGPLAMVSQSGGFGYSVVSYAQAAGLGFGYMASTGNETDVDTTEVLAWFVEQPEVEIVVSYLEGVIHGERLRAVGRRALALGKPILVWKVGNTSVGRAAAASHTANLTAAYDLYRETFRCGGFVEVHEMHEIADVAHAFLSRKLPAGRSVGVVTTSGGAGVLLADELSSRGLTLPEASPQTVQRLQAYVPGFAALANPMDLSAQLAQSAERFNAATAAIVADPALDQLILRSFPGAAVEAWGRGLIEIAAQTAKPILVSISGLRQSIAPIETLLAEAGIPAYDTPTRAAIAAASLADFAQKKRAFGRRAPPRRDVEQAALPLPATGKTLSEHEAKRCLAAYGISVVAERRLTLDAVDALTALPLSAPLAVKIDSPDIAHKTEAGGVRLGIRSLSELQAAAREIVDGARRFDAQARIDGVLLQSMASGVEAIAGALNDPYFGPVVVFGAGGTLAELVADRALRFAPFDEAEAMEMIRETRVARLLDGYRGSARGDIESLARALSRLSWLIADHRERIAEIDVNPIFVGPGPAGAVAADALIVLR